MPQKLQFSKAIIESFGRKATGGTAKISCSFTKTVCSAMEWGDPQDWGKSANLIGELKSSMVEFTPNHSDLQKFAFELKPAAAVYGFNLVRVQVKKGKGATKNPTFRTELHFAIDFTDPEGAAFLEKFLLSAGECSLKVTYEEVAKQETLPGTTDADSKQGQLEGMVDDIAKKRKEVN